MFREAVDDGRQLGRLAQIGMSTKLLLSAAGSDVAISCLMAWVFIRSKCRAGAEAAGERGPADRDDRQAAQARCRQTPSLAAP